MAKRLLALVAGVFAAGVGQADVVSFSGDLRADATFISCGSGCTLGAGDSDSDYAQWAAVERDFTVAPIFSAGGCGSPIIGAVGPTLTIWVQPSSTQTITYSTPMVFAGAGVHTCIAATTLSPSDHLEINVNGFVN
jgi:hypothetical protein